MLLALLFPDLLFRTAFSALLFRTAFLALLFRFAFLDYFFGSTAKTETFSLPTDVKN